MADFRVKKVESGHSKIRSVPIAVTPEGFWCCPAPVVFQKTAKNLTQQNKQKTSSPSPPPSSASLPKPTNSKMEKKTPSRPRSRVNSDDQGCLAFDVSTLSSTVDPKMAPKPISENPQRKISVSFGQAETSDMKVVLFGKEGITVRMTVHRSILEEHSSFFAEKLSKPSPVSCIEIRNCADVEIYVETVGLMYCKEVKKKLIRQNVPRVLRILKVAELLGFHTCMKLCLEYLEAVPWVGEEEERVVSSIRHLTNDNYVISPILKRVSSDIPGPSNDTLAHILELVLRSNDDRGRREMKSLVLKLLKENNYWINQSSDVCTKTLYSSCRSCLDSLLINFRQASEPGFAEKSLEIREPVARQITQEADNLIWLVEILSDRNTVEEFALMWASQDELAALHPKLPTMTRHLISGITARLFVGIGRGEMLPSKETRQMLLQVWLQPLVNDYSWLQHGCRSFDQKVVEEGIGRTILTLPLEDQQTILLSWLGSFLKGGDNCPNLQRAFEVWWRRTFIRPYVEQQGDLHQSDRN